MAPGSRCCQPRPSTKTTLLEEADRQDTTADGRAFSRDDADSDSRQQGVELYRLEQWRDRAFEGIDAALRERGGDPVQAELDQAMKRIGELSMENELLRERCKAKLPLAPGRPRR